MAQDVAALGAAARKFPGSVPLPPPVLSVFRGVGQVFFQENALSGLCFLLGIAWSSPRMALGGLLGAAIGTGAAMALRYRAEDIRAGLYGFNAALVGIATFFFFETGATSVGLLVAGSVAATVTTWLARRFVPFPTYTAPFIVVTWVLYFLGPPLGAAHIAAGGPLANPGPVQAVANGISQVMFQANLVTGLLFFAGIALSDWRHASWVLAGSIIGMWMGNHHATTAFRALDPERLVERALTENTALGLYGYNATLAAVALFLWRRSLVPPLLGILISVVFTEWVPLAGLPALTAPFVLATWLVLALGWLDARFLNAPEQPPPSSS